MKRILEYLGLYCLNDLLKSLIGGGTSNWGPANTWQNLRKSDTITTIRSYTVDAQFVSKLENCSYKVAVPYAALGEIQRAYVNDTMNL